MTDFRVYGEICERQSPDELERNFFCKGFLDQRDE